MSLVLPALKTSVQLLAPPRGPGSGARQLEALCHLPDRPGKLVVQHRPLGEKAHVQVSPVPLLRLLHGERRDEPQS